MPNHRPLPRYALAVSLALVLTALITITASASWTDYLNPFSYFTTTHPAAEAPPQGTTTAAQPRKSSATPESHRTAKPATAQSRKSLHSAADRCTVWKVIAQPDYWVSPLLTAF